MGYKTPPGNHWQQLNARQRLFVKLYNGDSQIAGNATRCYMAAYDQPNQQCAQRAGSRLVQRNEHVKALLAQAEARAADRLAIDAEFVKAESLRLYKRAMGDDSFEQVDVRTDPETGEERVSVRSRRDYDPSTAKAALQMIGQHRDVQAFSQVIEHNHTHHLEQRLAARSKMIEGRAQVLDDTGDPGLPGQTDPHQLQHDPGQGDSAGDIVIPDAHANGAGMAIDEVPAEHTPKRVHIEGGQSDQAHDQEKTTAEREGATAK